MTPSNSPTRDELTDADFEALELQDDLEEDDAVMDFDCHMDRRGACGLAGTEECDFECPWNRRRA